MGPATDDGSRVWIDLCILGSHLPQMYRPTEFEPATRELAEKHELCPTCLGYGNVPFRAEAPDGVWARCDDCRGSGSSKFFVDITQNADGSVIEGRVTPRDHGPKGRDDLIHGPKGHNVGPGDA